MKIQYIGDYYKVSLIKNKIYDVMSIESNWYRIMDETGDDYLYAPEQFKIIEA